MSSQAGKRKKDIQTLKKGYNIYVRIFEIASIIVFCVLFLAGVWRIKGFFVTSPLIAAMSFFSAWIVADFLTGLLHWFFDTWGRFNWPILGKTFVRPFLEHHITPNTITEHDWIETNGSNMFAGSIIIVIAFLVDASMAWFTFALFISFWGCLTNQFHKWSHQTSKKTPYLVACLQKTGLVLSKENHDFHHQGNFDRHYCITNGFLNPFLDKVGFFRSLERVIRKVTGIQPRDNELP